MSARTHALPAAPRGMALIAVLWIVAALSLMVMGLSATTRVQIHVAATQRDAASGQAVGDAAIQLALQALLAEPTRPAAAQRVQVAYQGVEVAVDIAPLDGLIALNGADAHLFATLLQSAGGLPAAQAQTLAVAIVQWRDTPPSIDPTAAAAASQPARIESPEDLLLVPGMDYAVYARIAPLVSADLPGGSQINPAAAPPGVLLALSGGNSAQVAQYIAQRDSGQPGGDASFLDPRFAAARAGGGLLYRLQASVPLQAGKILLLTRDVALEPGATRGLPWRGLRQSRHIVTTAS
ncbi:MAG: type II secretion system protein GspK [Pseudomonadota bacterium]|nr:type II secretion system protein GspK [Pseudomonadota bacterium]